MILPLLFLSSLFAGQSPNLGYEVRLDVRAAHPLQVWRGGQKVAEALLREFSPWKVIQADVDGDGTLEINVGVTKPTPLLPFPHRTLFVMRFDGKRVVRKWAGSSLGRPLVDFAFGPPDPNTRRQTLFTLEKTLDNQLSVCGHRWMGFGFQKVGRQKTYKMGNSLHVTPAGLILRAEGSDIEIPSSDLK